MPSSNDGHLLNLDYDLSGSDLMAFTPDGKRINISSKKQRYYCDFGKKYRKSNKLVDFMTVPKDEAYNMKRFYGYGYGETFKNTLSFI